jgi:Uma2 family endonuclease
MASVLPKPLAQSETGGPFRFTLEQFFGLSEGGAFGDYRVELLNGGLFVMPRQGPPHAELVRRLNEQMVSRFASRFRVSPQCPVVLLAPPPDYVEPDMALLKLKDYSERDVTSEDVELIVEISDSTLQRDQGEKLEAYARNRIPEAWVLDVNAKLLHIYQDCNGEMYRQTRVLEAGTPAWYGGEKLEWW